MSEREALLAATKELLNRVFRTSEDDWSWDKQTEVKKPVEQFPEAPSSVEVVSDPEGAKVMFIGEPGSEEADWLFDKILASIGLTPDTVYIAEIVEEKGARTFLNAEISRILPKVVVTLGDAPARVLKGAAAVFIHTHAPAALLANPELKKKVWEDMKSLRNALK